MNSQLRYRDDFVLFETYNKHW